MKNLLYLFGITGGYDEGEYYNLSDEEKDNYDYMNYCLFNDNKKINTASFNIMTLLLKISNEPNDYEPEVIHEEINKIYEGLTPEEIKMMEKFIPACINCMGMFNEEGKKLRRQKKGIIAFSF